MSERPGRSSVDQARIKKLEHENKKLRIANEILKKASAQFAWAGRPPARQTVASIAKHRWICGDGAIQ